MYAVLLEKHTANARAVPNVYGTASGVTETRNVSTGRTKQTVRNSMKPEVAEVEITKVEQPETEITKIMGIAEAEANWMSCAVMI